MKGSFNWSVRSSRPRELQFYLYAPPFVTTTSLPAPRFRRLWGDINRYGRSMKQIEQYFFERPGTCCYSFILMNVRIYLFTMIHTGVCNSSSLSYYTGPLHYVVFLFQSCSERNKPTMCLPNPQLYFADSLILKCIPLLEPYFETWNCRRAHVFP